MMSSVSGNSDGAIGLSVLPNINKKVHKEQGHMNILNQKWPGNDWFNPNVDHEVLRGGKAVKTTTSNFLRQVGQPKFDMISQAGLSRADRSCFKSIGSRRWCRFGRVPQILIVPGIGEF